MKCSRTSHGDLSIRGIRAFKGRFRGLEGELWIARSHGGHEIRVTSTFRGRKGQNISSLFNVAFIIIEENLTYGRWLNILMHLSLLSPRKRGGGGVRVGMGWGF